ncbi:MFS transporter, PAT family, beta-lactamase induction signal transducer AmpG [Myxococcus fulvus]|uniref:MFS transporter n=1 Tax=Myxococcus fulvus TaxID=33 RepID=A0A511T3L1_MYXFU|nr:MFS transporter [Myxococcus fulvus]GEN08162.1 MFS transporter [Myxococcus fulvus]SEU22505.1 MFS transporter, PAT family, beta-lactamase induction signal transducer AmpG [Myxococcus fulvus]
MSEQGGKSGEKRPGTWASLARAMASWRTASVTLLSFSSGLPLGLVWIAIPDWLRSIGVDIRVVGLITLAQAPWSFKFIWSPLMDRYVPPFWGRRRGWMAVAQVALFATTLALAGLGEHPEAAWVVGALAMAVAFASATQDIAIDAYAVEVLRKEEQGVAVGARVALYRAAMFIAGSAAITLAGRVSWKWVVIGLATLYLPMLIITRFAPEPEERLAPPKSLKDAVWYPFVGFLSRHRALEILAFVFLYKLADNLGGTLLRPFLVDMGYSDLHRGVALGTIGLFGTILGTLVGGAWTTVLGLGRALWVFGVIQIVSNIGYVLVARAGAPSVWLMYSAIGFEQVTQGLGTGAFSVLLMRLTQKRFSATQFALLSSLFSIPRVVAGPIAGFLVYSIGWEPFFWFTMVGGIPGLLLLARFVPLGVRDPDFDVQSRPTTRAVSRPMMVGSAALAAVVGMGLGLVTTALLTAVQNLRKAPQAGFDFATPFGALFQPASVTDWVTLASIIVFGLTVGLLTAAVLAARSGAFYLPEQEAPPSPSGAPSP